MSGRWKLNRAFLKVYRDDALVDQDMKCRYCRDNMTFASSTIEHRTPRSRLGDGRRSNISASCRPCNLAKGDMTDPEFMALLQAEPVGRPNSVRACWRRRQANLSREIAASRGHENMEAVQ
jgi:5-methylcytosine-specific restriction endonuclease McrA